MSPPDAPMNATVDSTERVAADGEPARDVDAPDGPVDVTTSSPSIVPVAVTLALPTAALLVVASIRGGAHPGAFVAVAGLVPAAVVDVRCRRLPDRLVAAAALGLAVTVIVASSAGRSWSAADVCVGAAMFGVPLLVVHLVVPSAMGFGDVKAALVLGAGLGLVHPHLPLVALFVATGTTAAVGLASRRRTLPLGPGLVVGAAAALAVASTPLADRVIDRSPVAAPTTAAAERVVSAEGAAPAAPAHRVVAGQSVDTEVPR